ncbi:hypothetical protein ACS0TY_001897 [Phlomoides rotata]
MGHWTNGDWPGMAGPGGVGWGGGVGNGESMHLLVLWILFENVMSLHRPKTTIIGLLEFNRVNEWVVTEKLGNTMKQKYNARASKRPRSCIRERYSTEKSKGSEDYSVSDALVKFAKSRGVAIRGHNVFWDDSRYEPSWVGGLSTNDLRASTNKRIHSVLSRYKGQLFHWDVVNENLHFSFFESKLGQSISTTFYQQANKIDGRTIPFLNDYNTIEDNRDGDASPSKYLQKIAHLRREGYNGPLGIGLEGHFTTSPNLAYISQNHSSYS